MNTPTPSSGSWRVTVAALLPLVVLLLVFLVLWLPGFFIQPGYDFLYGDTSRSGQFYNDAGEPVRVVVRQDRLVAERDYNHNPDYRYSSDEAAVYYHDTVSNESRRVPLEDLDQYRLVTGNKSPDGFSLNSPNSIGTPLDLVVSGGERQHVLSRGLYHREQNLELPGYGYGFNFYGWVERDGAR